MINDHDNSDDNNDGGVESFPTFGPGEDWEVEANSCFFLLFGSPGIGLQGGHEWVRSTFNPQAETYDWLLICLGRQQGLHILKSICQGLGQVSQDRNECE